MTCSGQRKQVRGDSSGPDRRGKPVLEVAGLSVSVRGEDGEREVVSDLSFSLARGETLCIAGESGSGKSMTALAIMQLAAAAGGARLPSGRIRLDDIDLATLGESADAAHPRRPRSP